MDIETRLALLQNTYAASIAETVNTYDKLKVLDTIVERRKERQAQTAPFLNQQLGIETVEDVFGKLSEIYGCANWSVETTDKGYVATAVSCKLCALSKKMGGANPCNGWCLDPMSAMITAAGKIDAESIIVESTLMVGDCCKVLINISAEQDDTAETSLTYGDDGPNTSLPSRRITSGCSILLC
ncbi:MAG TPA: hypothetical protein PLM74_03230 [Bacillota bacterium]|jgi:hypothetical protein|nr:hypothetical protein [Bacillota bacterium]